MASDSTIPPDDGNRSFDPIEALADLRLPADEDFVSSVRRRIERRELVADAIVLTLSGLVEVATEWLDVLFTGLTENRSSQKEK